MGTFAADLDLLVQAIQTVSSTKNYWLIRTQSGSLYQTFITNNYISIGLAHCSLSITPKLTSSELKDGMIITSPILISYANRTI